MSATQPVEPPSLVELAFAEVRSDDGTRLRAWTNDPDGAIDGPTVLLCNGLGTNPYAWPELLEPDCGVRLISWNHRGTGRSERPEDPSRVDMDVFVASPEDVVLSKLEWALRGGSERQLQDAAAVLAVQGDRLDVAYVELWAARLGVGALWRGIVDG